METKDYEYFSIWSETDECRHRIAKAKEVIENALRTFRKPYVSFSGGKDSTVLTHIALQYDSNITVVHWDFGPYFVPRFIEREIVSNVKKCGVKNLRMLTSPAYEKLGRNARNILGKHFIGIEIPKLIKEGYDMAFIGLRKEESCKRKSRTKNSFSEYDKRGITNIFPIRDLVWQDVWAYIVANNVPYLGCYYDKYAKLLGYERVRFTTLFDPEFNHLGVCNVDKFLMWKYEQSF